MAITELLDPAQMPNQDMDQQTFDNLWAAVLRALPNWGSQANALAANLNSIAAGGANSIPYTFDASGITEVDPGPGKLRVNNATQSQATAIYLDILSAAGNNVSGIIDTFNSSTSATKGTLRIQKANDPSRWMMFKFVMSYPSAGYRALSVTPIGNFGSPFTNGDAVMLFFDPTGDKGDTGPAGSLLVPRLHVREQYSSGTVGPTLSSSTWATRAKNTVVSNTISNAAVAANQVALDPGTYDFRGWAIAVGTDGRHRIGLKNITAGSFIAQGSSEFVGPNTYTTGGKSVLEGRVTLSVRTAIELQHYVSGAFTAGSPVNNGSSECYSELIFEKVA